MNSANLAQKYMEESVLTMPGSQQISLLYDALLVNITKGIQSLNKKDYEKSNNALIKSQDIVLYLMDCLNMNYAISHNLYALYEYSYRQLVKANIVKDTQPLAEIYSLIAELKTAWKQAVNQKNS
jgi:flagellar protein FliS